MWLEARFRLCPVSERALVLQGGEEYGSPFLVERLRRQRRVAWLDLADADVRDPVAIGNRLADAVNSAVDGNLLQNALHYLVHLRTLALRRTRLPAFTLVVNRAELAPDFVHEAARARLPDVGLWLLGHSGFEGIDAVRLGTSDLRLTPGEARKLAPAGISDDQVLCVYLETDGAYTRFLSEVHELAGLPELLVPLGDGWSYPEQRARAERPDDVLEAMVRLGRWVDALELAAEHLPERVDELLAESGPAYQQQGLLGRLDLLLCTLPPPLDSLERTLEWRLLAAHQAGTASRVLPQVRRHLQAHEAPSLRARYAAFAPYQEGLEEAARAVRAEASPLTLWQLGRMHPEAREGIELLTRSITRAEQEGDAYGCARAAGTLAARLLHRGEPEAARSWASWGLQIYDEHELKDGVRRLLLYNDLAFARMMLSDTGGLREQLEELHATVENVLPDLAASYRSALADLERVEGDPRLAAEYTRANLDNANRLQKGLRAYQHVRSLLELGELGEASRVAEAALALSAGVPAMQDLRARLALGMVQAFSDPRRAVGTLRQVLSQQDLVFEQRAIAALHFLLASPEGLGEIPEELRLSLAKLSETALRVLSGPPEAFHRVWRLLGGSGRPTLEIKVLGRSSARLEGAEVRLTGRQWEILLALALHPEGLGYDALHAFLLHDDQGLSPGTLRSHVSHLRERIPISDTPYRIEVPFTVDALEVQGLLRRGLVREAISLVNGQVLPESGMPGIREVAEQLDQALRECVLSSGDHEALYSATGLWGDDLQIWEASLEALHPRDPRVPLLRSRISALRQEYGLA